MEKLNGLFVAPAPQHHVHGKRTGYRNPVVGRTVHDMLLQSWAERYVYSRRTFPNGKMYSSGPENRRRFLVSAVRKGGKTSFIRIKSLAGEPCILRTDMANPVVKAGNATLTLQKRVSTYWI